MALRNIYKDGEEVLRKISKPIEKVDKKIIELMNDLVETMHANNGVGLAAPQVGVLKRVIAVHVDEKEEPIVLANPIIKESSGERICVEGCLSIPEVFGEVKRPKKIKVEGLNIKGELVTIEADDNLLANALCHEIDHLDGILFKDKVIKYVDVEEHREKRRKEKR